MNTRQTVKNTETLWRALEQEHVAPRAVDLPNLSGLSAEELRRFERAWPEIQVSGRRQLLQTLAQLAEADFEMDFNAIFRLALHDRDPEVRIAGAEGLWEDDDVRLIPELLCLLLEDDVAAVRIAATQCLAHFILLGELGKIRSQPFAQACEVLSLVHQNPDELLEVRRRALESLAYASVAELPALIRAAHTHPEEAMQISAVFAMGRSADPRWKDIVVGQLHHPSPAMRYEAARACGELLARDAVPDLVELTEDVDLEVQEAALWALGQIGGDQARLTLERHLHSDNETLRTAANEALQELEFLHGNLETFFGPPEDFASESDLPWNLTARREGQVARWRSDNRDAFEDEDDETSLLEEEDDFEDDDDFDDEYADEGFDDEYDDDEDGYDDDFADD